MTNTSKLQGKMRECGFTLEKLASVVGISPTGLFNKVHNKVEFLVSEVQKIGAALNLSQQDTNEIFFSQDVELNSTQ